MKTDEKTDALPEVKTGTYARKRGEIVLREHKFDGIQEYDQRLPNWWLFTFYIMIVAFVAFWVGYYNLGLNQSMAEKVDTRMAAIQKRRDDQMQALLATLDDKTLMEWSRSQDIVGEGKSLYLGKGTCATCHGTELTAVNNGIPLGGRSLADGEWVHGGNPMDVFRIISDGSPPDAEGLNGAKMVPWKVLLSGREMAKITAFLIHSNSEDFKDY
ncbi:MAG: cbb3-type cytochrome c oxidase N-terminal domain-containing protein [Verrucomicrobiota bacterium]